ncbi:DUF89 family protein [Candidatus Thorarchaeota archaeon]|nr:MAG: DUF89 family protein [Candidatus Thorarchaeota archaeon]
MTQMTDDLTVPLIPECSACIINSLRTAVPLLTDDEEEQHSLFSLAYRRIAEGYEKRIKPITLSIELYQEIYTLAGKDNPYRQIKLLSKKAALRALPEVEKRIQGLQGKEKLDACLAAAVVGNMIDFNTSGHRPDLEGLVDAFDEIFTQGFVIDDSKHLWSTLQTKPGKMLLLSDNAGEVILDIPLVRFVRDLGWRVFFVVKGRPMVNDATREDVSGTEIESLAEVIDSGAWAHGVPLKWVSEKFLEHVKTSDLVISKGQANIESFPEIQRMLGVETYYVTRAKCPHISSVLGVETGTNVILRRPRLEDNV